MERYLEAIVRLEEEGEPVTVSGLAREWRGEAGKIRVGTVHWPAKRK
jgi:hypothetical protein